MNSSHFEFQAGGGFLLCDLGLALGLASGVATAVGEQQTAHDNTAMIQQQANLEYASQERERLVEIDSANKEGYQSQLETDRAVAAARASGEGMGGLTAAARVAEQQRQGALSIANAKDKIEGANANYAMAGKNTQIASQNRIDTLQPNPLATLTDIATAGLTGYGKFSGTGSGGSIRPSVPALSRKAPSSIQPSLSWRKTGKVG